MEANHGQADDALARAREKLEAGDFEAAARFAEKSARLYDTEEARGMIEHCKKYGQGSEAQQAINKVMTARDHWAVMNIPPNSSAAVIKKAYKHQSLALHPDRNHAPGADEAFRRLHEAYEALSKGDHGGVAEPPPPPAPSEWQQRQQQYRQQHEQRERQQRAREAQEQRQRQQDAYQKQRQEAHAAAAAASAAATAKRQQQQAEFKRQQMEQQERERVQQQQQYFQRKASAAAFDGGEKASLMRNEIETLKKQIEVLKETHTRQRRDRDSAQAHALRHVQSLRDAEQEEEAAKLAAAEEEQASLNAMIE